MRSMRCMSWPVGLRLVLLWNALAALVGVFQIFYWAKVTQEFFPHLSPQGSYALIVFPCSLLSVLFAMMNRRRVLVGISLPTAVVHVFSTLTWFLQTTWDFPELLALDAITEDGGILRYTGPMAWNGVVLLGWLLVFWYLMRYEVCIRGDETAASGVRP